MEIIRSDRLSNLPDSIIHEILSRLDDTQEAARTCILSKNWTHHWKYVHSLSFHHESFKTGILAFEEFILHVLQHRQHSINIRKLRFFLGAKQNQFLINCVFDHAMMRQLKELETDVYSFPPSLLESRALETVNYGAPNGGFIVPSNSMNFARLKNLQLTGLHIDCNDLFSSCSNLENLRLTDCRVSNTEILNINSPRLVQLIITDIRYDNGLIIISGPKLKRFEFKGIYNPHNPSSVLEIRSKMNEVKLEMRYPLFSRDTNNVKEFQDFIIPLTQSVQEHAKLFNLTFNFYATRVLSKQWRYHWTNVHALNFECSGFRNRFAFAYFVTNVLHHRKPRLNLVKLRFYYGNKGSDRALMIRVLYYADISNGVRI
ncbi:hypothetical protein LWI29_009310 [Acer saccharum]|uniref:F-box domain-containing protein n=1 Tax=Acer saccharum TaxID=4024 RepID=A0AA39VQT8_ACESA|nr:hypothetical protein LWI29_009310 [Acer saccharum]